MALGDPISSLFGGLCVTSTASGATTWTGTTSAIQQSWGQTTTGTVYNSTSNGLGSIFPIQQPPPPPPFRPAQQKQPYFIELPDYPVAGDSITVYFDGTRWLEKSQVANRKSRPNGGFSLDELEEARKIMEDCGAV